MPGWGFYLRRAHARDEDDVELLALHTIYRAEAHGVERLLAKLLLEHALQGLHLRPRKRGVVKETAKRWSTLATVPKTKELKKCYGAEEAEDEQEEPPHLKRLCGGRRTTPKASGLRGAQSTNLTLGPNPNPNNASAPTYLLRIRRDDAHGERATLFGVLRPQLTVQRRRHLRLRGVAQRRAASPASSAGSMPRCDVEEGQRRQHTVIVEPGGAVVDVDARAHAIVVELFGVGVG